MSIVDERHTRECPPGGPVQCITRLAVRTLGLAVALGVAGAVITPPAISWAEPSDFPVCDSLAPGVVDLRLVLWAMEISDSIGLDVSGWVVPESRSWPSPPRRARSYPVIAVAE